MSVIHINQVCIKCDLLKFLQNYYLIFIQNKISMNTISNYSQLKLIISYKLLILSISRFDIKILISCHYYKYFSNFFKQIIKAIKDIEIRI